MKKILFALLLTGAVRPASAVDYSANLGFGGTRATSPAGSVEARFNGRFGIGVELALDERWTFSTGTDYTFRRVSWRRNDGARLAIDFDYVDVPLDARVRVTSLLSAFAGFRFGINVSDKVETQRGTGDYDPVARAIITLGEVGARLDLPRAFALETFYEHEIGDGFAKNLEAFRTWGGRIVYIF